MGPVEDGVDPLAQASAWRDGSAPSQELIHDCVHCGFCLTSCPSYSIFKEEMDSPRGRIVLMDVGHDADSEISPEMVAHFDRCLGCMACVTACPSGVQYDRLIEQVRPQIESSAHRSWIGHRYRQLVFALFTHPARLRMMVPALVLQRISGTGRWLARHVPNGHLRALLQLAPDVKTRAAVQRLERMTPPSETVPRKGRVALMQGCLQRVFFNDVNAATVRVLAAEGWEVHAPRKPRCCGALQLHAGFEDEAISLAKATIAAYEEFDAIAVNVAGCGSAMKDYGAILAEDPAWAHRAERFSAKVKDVHELLDDHDLQSTLHPLPLSVAYHDACHLAHGQGIRNAPRELLRAIPQLEVREPPEWEICCGSAGTYNLMQPDAAQQLGQRKAANLLGTDADLVAAANPGCALQITAHLPPDQALPVLHPMTLLDLSIRGQEVPLSRV